MRLNGNLHYVLIGLMLGDGSLYRPSKTGNTRFEMSFGTKYKLFAESIGELFKEQISLRANTVKPIEVKVLNKVYANYRLKTKSMPVFNHYYESFYKFNTARGKYVKIVPEFILKEMNPIILAYLIMSDGNYDRSRNRVRIYTNSFSKQEVEMLQKAIQDNLGLYAGVLHDRKDQWILTIGANYLSKLREIVLPYFENSMLYRINM